MFANLKNKLIEEVKSSPAKLQQFANAAQAAVSSSTSSTPSGSESTTTTTNENFFSITEEDTPQNSPYKSLRLTPGTVRGRSTTPQALNNGTGAIPRSRKLSNSSMASDASFRLPSYDSPAVYHLQSDLESNCSELEDTASTTNLDIITKDQLYDAYKKSLDRYHKYRCRYTDLAKKYKDLERDSTKARSVLVETQDKAIRRISELREQCALEQQAKAHLEEALRMEMDDMQCKMQSYQTKLNLLGENPDSITSGSDIQAIEPLIDLRSNSHESPGNSSTINVGGKLINPDESVEKINQLEKQLLEREQQLQELTEKLDKSTSTIESLKKQEEENALLLAQTKQAIHSELENKESEVKKLTDTIKKIQSELQTSAKKESHLSGQIGDFKEVKERLKEVQISKQEIDAKLVANEYMLAELKEQYAAKDKELISTKEKVSLVSKESEQKIIDLRQQNAQLSEMVQRYQQNEVSLAEIDNELNRTKNENHNLKATLTECEQKALKLEREMNMQKEIVERSKLEQLAIDEKLETEKGRSEELAKQLQDEITNRETTETRVNQLENELRILSDQNANNESETIAALKIELHRANAELNEQLNTLKEQHVGKEKELKSTMSKLAKQKRQHETQQNRIKGQSEEIEKLKVELNKHEHHLERMQIEARERETQAESEKNELRTQLTNILHEISQMEAQMHIVQKSHAELETKKLNLELKIEDMQQQAQVTNDGTQRWREQLATTEEQLKQVELKLQNVESENSLLAEKNCLLEENSNRLEKLIVERERQQAAEEVFASEMRLKLETAEDALQKLNEKMSQVLDENSRMHNVQELMDHDCRTLQDKCDSLEKEKLLAEDAQKCLESELKELMETKKTEEMKMRELVEQLMQTEEKYTEERKKTENVLREREELQNSKEKLLHEMETLTTQLNCMRSVQNDDDKLRNLLEDKQIRIKELEAKLQSNEKIAKDKEVESNILREEVNRLEKMAEELESGKEERELLRRQTESLNQELNDINEEVRSKSEAYQKLEAKLEKLAVKEAENDTLKNELSNCQAQFNKALEETNQLQQQLEELNTATRELNNLRVAEQSFSSELSKNKDKYTQKIKELEANLSSADADIEKLHESNDAFQVEIDQLKSTHQLQEHNLENAFKQLQEQHLNLQEQAKTTFENSDKLINYEQMQVENEYLNKHVKQLEIELESQQQETVAKLKDIDELKEKLKSIQCEMYVLKENAEKYDFQLREKQAEISDINAELLTLRETFANEREEAKRQVEHAQYITEQNDTIQKELLHSQQQLSDMDQKLIHTSAELEKLKETSASETDSKENEMESFRAEIKRNHQIIEKLNKEVGDITAELQIKEKLEQELNALRVELKDHTNTIATASHNETVKSAPNDAEHLRKLNEALQSELEDLKHKSTSKISNLQQEIEDMENNAKHMTERLMELERLRAGIQAQKLLLGESDAANAPDMGTEANESNDLQREKQELETKLQQIINDVQEVSNRNVFLEQQCENYLILEQSNERLKLQNAKLSRQLDETLVSMQHNENISANTEFEYLKNIMFQYLTGSANGNNETLVKVISAVLKFTPQQTQVALEKEHQRRSLLNKII